MAVDDTEIKGWDVKDIVGLIVGPQDTQVRLQVASLPAGLQADGGGGGSVLALLGGALLEENPLRLATSSTKKYCSKVGFAYEL